MNAPTSRATTPAVSDHHVRDWRHQAACRDVDPETFFPIGKRGPDLIQTAYAKSVCATCTVMAECRSWAMETGQDTGVWGGLSEDERRAPRRRSVGPRAAGGQEVPLVRQVLARLELLESMVAAGLTYEEIAGRIGVPGATRNVIGEAMRQVRQWKRERGVAVGVAA